MPEPEQSYAKHAKFVPPFHFFLAPLLAATLVGACINLYHSLGDHERLYSAALLAVLTFAVLMTALFARVFALKAQDRAIRAEENLRHYVLTGQLLDRGLKLRQIIALRFASDAEFPALSKKALAEGMSSDAIKRAIVNWRADHDRL